MAQASVKGLSLVGLEAAPEMAHTAFASFASLGYCLGCTGLPLYQNGPRMEALASTSAVAFAAPDYSNIPNDFWYALSYDKQTASFDQVYVSDRQPGGISQILLLPQFPGMARRVAICGFDGSIRFYAADTKNFLPNQTMQFPVSDVTGCAIGDFDHSGHREYMLATRSAITVFDAAGNPLWTLPPADYFYQGVTAGQLDGDSALEFAVGQYTAPWLTTGPPLTIYDGATHAVQQQISTDVVAAAYGSMVATLTPGALPSLLVSEGQGAVDAVDPVAGTRLWQAITPINITSLAVARPNGVTQVFVGDGQWGAVHAFDGPSGAPLYSIHNPEYGVDSLAVGKLTTGASQQILWGSGGNGTGPKRFIVADTASQQIVAESPSIDPFFTSPVSGHISADGSRQVIFASQTTNDKYARGSVVALDAQSGKVIAVQSHDTFEDFGNFNALRVADLDGDGVDEVIVAGSHDYDGSIDVYEMTPNRSFALRSTTWVFSQTPYKEFTALALNDAAQPAAIYAVVGFRQVNQTTGVYESVVAALDPISGAERWRVALPASGDPGVFNPPPTTIESMGHDKYGRELFAVLRPTQPYSMDFPQIQQIDVIRVTRTGAAVVASKSGLFMSMAVTHFNQPTQRILAGTQDGAVYTLAFNGSALQVLSSPIVASAPIEAVRAGRFSDFWIVSGTRAFHLTKEGRVTWQSTDNGYSTRVGLLIDDSADQDARLWVSSVWRVDGFKVPD